MEFSAQQIAGLLNGEIVGNADTVVNKVSKIEEGEVKSLSFLANMSYEEYLYTTDASIVIINKDFNPAKSVKSTCTLIKVDNAYESFAKLLATYDQAKNNKVGVSKKASISDEASMGNDAYVGDFAYIGDNTLIGNNAKIYPHTYIGDNVKIGDNTTIFSGVKIYHDCEIGNNCTIHAGAVIGADGFGFAPNSDNEYHKVPQIGNVIINDHVEIGANSSVDRATIGATVINTGVKIDNLVHIAHNVVIGKNTVIAGHTGISGSTKLGENCMVGGQVGIVGHITIGDNVKIAGQSGVTKNIKNNSIIQGSPAFSNREYARSYAGFRNLPSIVERMDNLEKKVDNNG